jgi:hypothetical protein
MVHPGADGRSAVSQSGFVAAVMLAAFVLFLAARDRLSTYLGFVGL